MLFSVISELLPACTAFGFGEEMGKKVCFSQKEIIKSKNIKRLCAESNDKKTQQILTVCKIMMYTVNTAENEYTDKQQKRNNDKNAAEYSRCFRLFVNLIKPRFQRLLHIFRKVFCQPPIRHKNGCCQYHQTQQVDIAECQMNCHKHQNPPLYRISDTIKPTIAAGIKANKSPGNSIPFR